MNTPSGPAIQVRNLTKQYKDVTALNDVNLDFEADAIHGLFGKNGAGKTTLMSLITAQNFPTAGSVKVFGVDPFTSPEAVANMIFVRDDAKFPDAFTAKDAFTAARLFFANWDQAWADELVKRFDLPLKRQVRKMSRGQTSATGVILGLASRAPITFLDEPYLGLDASARQVFYDSLLEDFAENPRTIILSSHLIDEIASIISRVVVLDAGKVILDRDEETLGDYGFTITGDADAVAGLVVGREVLETKTLGHVAAATVVGSLSREDRTRAAELGLDVGAISLQEFIVHITSKPQAIAA
jgi:ABC-2 type transport system ATP-binding protein